MESNAKLWEDKYGDIVWGKFGKEWWPAYVINPNHLNPRDEAYKPGVQAIGKKYTIIFLGDKSRYFNLPSNLKDYNETTKGQYKNQKIGPKYKESFNLSINIAESVCKLPKEVRMAEIFPEIEGNIDDNEEHKIEVDRRSQSVDDMADEEGEEGEKNGTDTLNKKRKKAGRPKKSQPLLSEDMLLDNPDSFELSFNFSEEDELLLQNKTTTNKGSNDKDDNDDDNKPVHKKQKLSSSTQKTHKKSTNKKNQNNSRRTSIDSDLDDNDHDRDSGSDHHDDKHDSASDSGAPSSMESDLEEDDISNASDEVKVRRGAGSGRGQGRGGQGRGRGRGAGRLSKRSSTEQTAAEVKKGRKSLDTKVTTAAATTTAAASTAAGGNKFENETALQRLQRLYLILQSTTSDEYLDEERALKTIEKIRNIACSLDELKQSNVIKLVMDLRVHKQSRIKDKANETRLYWKQHYGGSTNTATNSTAAAGGGGDNQQKTTTNALPTTNITTIEHMTTIPKDIQENIYRRRSVKLLTTALANDLTLAVRLEAAAYQLLCDTMTIPNASYFEFITRITNILQQAKEKDGESSKDMIRKVLDGHSQNNEEQKQQDQQVALKEFIYKSFTYSQFRYSLPISTTNNTITIILPSIQDEEGTKLKVEPLDMVTPVL